MTTQEEYEPIYIYVSGNEFPDFRLTITEKRHYSVIGDIDVIESWDSDNVPEEFSDYLHFFIKWDGCSHINFGGKQGDARDGYVHLCGANEWKKHIALMLWLYEWAEVAIPMKKDVAGTITFYQ